ncbi:MAG: cytochrome c biogenesis heme-transporting ATPase CcmA [Burkholderiaceae bacterium]|nr:cytochrome c biogenesis heme-transporting ATPase CcmA [Burkholderiaceae bacterium]
MKPLTGCSTSSGGATTSEAGDTALMIVRALACRRGNEWLFENLDFSVGRSGCVWLRGHNGSGKTSLLRVVAGLSRPDRGTVQFLRRTIDESEPDAASCVYIGHANGLKDDLTVFESLQFLARLHGRPAAVTDMDGALQRLGMSHRRNAFVRTLSQGQRRRVALARLALETAPTLWVLDEPYDALDASGIDVVDDMLVGHLARGGGVLLTSHLPLGPKAPRADVLELVRSPGP